MATKSDKAGNVQTENSALNQEDVVMEDVGVAKKRKATKTGRDHHEITSITITNPPFSYACLELISDPPSKAPLDDLTVRTYLTSAFTQFLGLTGAAISVDILKVEDRQCWIRVPREDLSAAIASIGAWIGGNEKQGQVALRVRASGNWLGSLVGSYDVEKLWTG